MKDELLQIKAMIVIFFSATAEILGWKGMLLLLWVAAMGLDYVTGSVAAKKTKEWKSDKAREGILHKAGMIFVVLVCAMFDLAAWVICNNMDFGIVWPGAVMPMACCWYFLTECGSILENCEKMGATIPSWLVTLMKSSLSGLVKSILKAFGKPEGQNDKGE